MKNITLSFTLLFLINVSCEDSNLFDVKIDFSKSLITAPAELADWTHAIFIFDAQKCTEVKLADNRNSLNEIKGNGGDRLTALVCENMENINLSSTISGQSSVEYYLSLIDINAKTPQIWMERKALNEENSLFLRPLTSILKTNLLNSPDSLKSVTITIPKMTDVLYISSGKTEVIDQLQNKQIEVSKLESGKESVLFPMIKANGAWTLNYKLNFENSVFSGNMSIDEVIEAGHQLEINFDFSDYKSKTHSLTFRTSNYGENSWIEKSETFFELYPGDDLYHNTNDYYNVYVLQDNRWKSVKVHNALVSNGPRHHTEIWNDWDNSKMLRDTMCYANFIDDFEEVVKVRVQKRKGEFNNAKVRPTNYEINTMRMNENTIEFTIPDWERRKFSIEFDDDRYHNLFLYPNRPDNNKPSESMNNVKYYGAGEHDVGEIKLYENETLYIDEGAVVYGYVQILGNNVTIDGRGVLSGERLPHIGNIYAEGSVLINARDVNNFKLSGITIIDSPSWTIALFSVNRVRIENINMICWILNGDGIDLCSVSDAEISDCFIRAYDDCITLKILSNFYTDTKDIVVRNCLFWTDYARGIMVGPESGDWTWGTGTINNCKFEDCIILEQPSGDGDFRAAISIVQQEQHGGGAALMDNITFHNIEIDNLQVTGRPICIEQTQQPQGGTMQNILFQNIKINDSKGYRYKSSIKTNNSWIVNLTFDNVTYNGEKIMGKGDRLDVDGNVEIFYK